MDEYFHNPVLLNETLQLLEPKDGMIFFDGTVGGGGHASALLQKTSPSGRLYGCDRDGDELLRTSEKLSRQFGSRCQLKQGNYSEVDQLFSGVEFDGALLDLGCSSMQFDRIERGFSFQGDAPLDMRMDRTQELTAEYVVNEYSTDELADLFFYYGGVRESRRLARAIEEERMLRRFVSTKQLASFIESKLPRAGKKIHPATRIFQAIRIEVNQEFEHLRSALDKLIPMLKPGARLAVITFHSGEDKIVKDFGRTLARDYVVEGEVDIPEFRKERAPLLKILTRKPVEPTEEEIKQNPRSRSARLRVFEKAG
ncbi:MAG: 16S rRNA (cytosine(1402)-N(4))-methyltransferase RsmH [Verrucomicrobia bacterium]|nr:16S rRNA (cytosine(1402)-N(4))-methyltransferase RsmH [Verrucomicrobiota bacterium]